MDHHVVVVVVRAIADAIEEYPRPVAVDGVQQARPVVPRQIAHVQPPFPGHGVDSDVLRVPASNVIEVQRLGRDGQLADGRLSASVLDPLFPEGQLLFLQLCGRCKANLGIGEKIHRLAVLSAGDAVPAQQESGLQMVLPIDAPASRWS